MNNVKVYLAQRMTNRWCNEILAECMEAKIKLEEAGFTVLSPVIEEGVPNKHIKLVNTLGRLRNYWRRDKEMLQQAHVMMDYNSQGKSDGVNVEMGLIRFCYWKPLIRIHPTLGCTISRIEYDCVTDTLDNAIAVLTERWGTKRKLLLWRLSMLLSSIGKFVGQQIKFTWDCI